jgi:hypothetical protein
MTTFLAVTLIAAHFAGDWYFQSREMALKKSKEIGMLLQHLAIVSAALFLPCLIAGKFWVLAVNALLHGLIDWNIWGFYKKKYGINFDHLNNKGFYDTIALDQCLHLVILFVLFSL